MSHFRLHDDLFSPVRCDISTVESSDSSEESCNDPLNFDEFSLTDAVKNKVTLAKSIRESPQENELKSKDENVIKAESVSSCRPILNKNLNVNLNAKKHSSKSKSEQSKGHKTTTKKDNDKSQQKKQESLHGKNVTDSHSPKSDASASDKLHKKEPRSASVSSKKETKKDSLKNIQKDSNQPLKCGSVNKEQKSQKKVIDSSSVSLESSDIKPKNSFVMSTELKKNTSSSHIDKKKSNSNSVIQQSEELNVNPLHTSYEASIKKMIHNSISAESAKIRQLMYMQQMSFYREMNKIKDSMEKQHFVTTERLFKVIEELMQMNASLRAGLSNVD